MPFHPLLVHLPIGALIVAGILLILELILKQETYRDAAFATLVIGTVGLVLAIITGNMAEGETVMTPSIHEELETHGTLGFVSAWFFGILTAWFYIRREKRLPIEKYLFLGLYWIGFGITAYGAHVGGTLVYEKGLGVEPMKEQIEAQRELEQRQGKTEHLENETHE